MAEGKPRKSSRDARQRFNVTKMRPEMVRLRSMGWTQVRIAEALGISQGSASVHLAAIEQEWRDQYLQDTDAIRAVERAQIEEAIAECMQRYRDEGEIKWLSEARQWHARLAQLLGLDAPQRQAVEQVSRVVFAYDDGTDEDPLG